MEGNQYFIQKEHLGIMIPNFTKDWEEYSLEEQLAIIRIWEKERAKIPDRIKQIEQKIDELQDMMFTIDFEEYLKIHKEIVNLSSAINDLNIWYRIEGEVTHK